MYKQNTKLSTKKKGFVDRLLIIIRHSTMSSGQQKRHRSSLDAIEGVDRTALKEEDGEEERGIINNDTTKKAFGILRRRCDNNRSNSTIPRASTGTRSNKWERTPIAL